MNPPRVIAVGFDGSPDSEAAVRWAGSLASATSATLRLVHAVGLLEHGGFTSPSVEHEEAAKRLVRSAGLDDASIEWRVRDGDPCEVLCREATGADGADLLVVGTRGTGARGGTLLGSTSLELAQSSPVPVVIVPSGP